MQIANLGVRAKLSLLAVAVVSLLYLLLGVTVFVVARQAIFASVDSGLHKMAEGFDRQHRRPPPHPPGMGPDDHGPDDHGPDHGSDHGGGPFNPPGEFGPGPRPDHGFGPGPDHQNLRNSDMRPRNDVIDIHDSRPRVVWMVPGARFPFPQSPPIDQPTVASAKRGVSTLHTVTFDDEPIRVLTIPVYNPDTKSLEGVMEMSYWLGDIYKVLNTLAGTLLLILPVGIILMGSASMYVVGKTLRPVRDIRTAAARIEAEDLSGRLPVTGSDEFAELADAMNGMLQRLDTAFAGQRETLEQLKEIIQQQRRFTADASHELKTPLAVVKVNASLLKANLARDPDGLESVDAIDQAVNRMSKLVQDLLLLARTDSGQLSEQFEAVDLSETAKRAVHLTPCRERITLDIPDESIWIAGSRFALERLMTNLLGNACRHTAPGGHVTLSLQSNGGSVVLKVCDDGEGIPEEHLGKIFARFHRVDSSRQSETGGTGLGLAICKGIVEAHSGTISVASEPGQGAEFKVCLPVHGESPMR